MLKSLINKNVKSVLKTNYVILGAGSKRAVLANRLSEDSNNNVILLEAGKSDRNRYDSWKIQMPATLTYNLADDNYNWNYYTTPQKNLNNRELHQPRGKVLGGSSSLNAMVYARGHKLDFDRWAFKENCPGWSYSDCLPYFKKAQNHAEGENKFRGINGPLDVCTKNYKENKYGKLFDIFVKAGVEAGYPFSEDLNGEFQEGFGKFDMTISPNGERCNSSNAYLRPILNRKNLKIITNAHITNLIINNNVVQRGKLYS